MNTHMLVGSLILSPTPWNSLPILFVDNRLHFPVIAGSAWLISCLCLSISLVVSSITASAASNIDLGYCQLASCSGLPHLLFNLHAANSACANTLPVVVQDHVFCAGPLFLADLSAEINCGVYTLVSAGSVSCTLRSASFVSCALGTGASTAACDR